MTASVQRENEAAFRVLQLNLILHCCGCFWLDFRLRTSRPVRSAVAARTVKHRPRVGDIGVSIVVGNSCPRTPRNRPRTAPADARFHSPHSQKTQFAGKLALKK